MGISLCDLASKESEKPRFEVGGGSWSVIDFRLHLSHPNNELILGD